MIFPLRVFGRASAKRMSSGLAIAPIILLTWVRRWSSELVACVETHSQRHERYHALTFQFVGSADDGRLGHRFMGDERALDFGGSEPMARDVEHVVDATDNPKIAVLVSPRSVTGEIAALDFAPVLLLESERCRRKSFSALLATACG